MPNWNKKATAKWYNDYAKDEKIPADQIVSVPSVRYKRIVRDVEYTISLMSLNDDDRVLDAGCGAGRFICRIRKTKSCRIVGIDTSRKMIERAKKRVANADYLIADVLHLPLMEEYFTAVICHSVLWHIPSETGSFYFNKDIYEKGFREFRRVLVAGGKMLFNVSNPFHLQSIIHLFIRAVNVKLLKSVGLQTYKISQAMVKHILTTLGFKISDVVASGYYPVLLETLYIPFGRTPSENMINIYYNAFDRLDNWLRRKTLFHTLAHTLIIKAIKRRVR